MYYVVVQPVVDAAAVHQPSLLQLNTHKPLKVDRGKVEPCVVHSLTFGLIPTCSPLIGP
jgi:hypothetical protein